MVLLTIAGALAATGVDAHDLHLAPSPALTVWSGTAPARWHMDALAEGAVEPLVVAGSTEIPPIDTLFSLDMAGSIPVAQGVAVHGALPLHLGVIRGGESARPVAGDLAVSVLVPLCTGPLRCGVRPMVYLPTGAPDAFLGTGVLRLGIEGAVSMETQRFSWALSAGGRSGPRITVLDYVGGGQLTAGLAAAVKLFGTVRTGAELRMRRTMRPGTVNWNASPVEAACTVRGRVGPVDLTIGGATAVSRSVGAPLARLFVGVGTGP